MNPSEKYDAIREGTYTLRHDEYEDHINMEVLPKSTGIQCPGNNPARIKHWSNFKALKITRRTQQLRNPTSEIPVTCPMCREDMTEIFEREQRKRRLPRIIQERLAEQDRTGNMRNQRRQAVEFRSYIRRALEPQGREIREGDMTTFVPRIRRIDALSLNRAFTASIRGNAPRGRNSGMAGRFSPR